MSAQSQILGALSGRRAAVLRTLPQFQKPLELMLALAVGWTIWHMPPSTPLDANGMHFLATLAAAVILWAFEVFDEFVIALMLLLSWLLFDIVPSQIGLAGFSKGSWFFILSALGIGAAVNKCGLLSRIALQTLRRIPPGYRIYTLIFTVTGLFVTPLLPAVKGRIVILSPLSQAISESIGFKPRSNGSAGLALSAFLGGSQLTFLFLTGASICLIGWSFLPEAARSEFGWVKWTLAALPAGLFTVLFLYAAIQWLFPLDGEEQMTLSHEAIESRLQNLGPVTRDERISFTMIALAVSGWATKSFHGVGEPWIALGALLGLLATGVLDKKTLRNNIDWGLLLFFGVIYGMGDICSQLKVDRWLLGLIEPILSIFSFHAIPFLLIVLLLVYVLRFFLAKTPAVILLSLVLIPGAMDIGIHPGVLLLTMLMGVESWFLPYQTPSYLIAYHSSEGKAFSHTQARKLMLVKFIISFLALLISIPYWKMLGLIG